MKQPANKTLSLMMIGAADSQRVGLGREPQVRKFIHSRLGKSALAAVVAAALVMAGLT